MNRLTAASAPPSAPPAADPPLALYGHAFARRWRLLAALAVAGALAGGVFGWLRPPVYEARASLEIRPLNSGFLDMDEASPTAPEGGERAELRTQARLLESRALADRVVENLNLLLGDAPELRAALDRVAGRTEIRADDGSRVFQILSRSEDPALAADFANALVAEFIERARARRVEAAAETAEWLDAQTALLRERLAESEQRLRAYADRNGFVTLTAAENVGAERGLGEIERELLEARSERMRLQARAEQLSGGVDALPEASGSTTLQSYRLRLSDLRRKRAELDTLYLPEHYQVKQVEAQIGEIEAAIAGELDRLRAAVRGEYEAAARRESLLDGERSTRRADLELRSRQAVDFEKLQREVAANRELLDTFLERGKQAGVAAALPAVGVQPLDVARAPERPLTPPPVLLALAGLSGGLFLGGVWTIARERLDDRLRLPGDIESTLGLLELGAVPDRAAEPSEPRMTPAGREWTAPPEDPVELAAVSRRASLIAECVRGVRTSLLTVSPHTGRGHAFVVTSASPGEGKTTLSLNLAVSFAEMGISTLLVDADLRRPRIHRLLGVDNRWGLADLLGPDWRGEVAAAALEIPEAPGLHVLTSGVARFGGPGLLHSGHMETLLERFRSRYDVILFDAPPALALTDARVLGRIADGAVVTCRAGRTRRPDAREAVRLLRQDGVRVIGGVLNGWDPADGPARRYSGYEAYFSPPPTEAGLSAAA